MVEIYDNNIINKELEQFQQSLICLYNSFKHDKRRNIIHVLAKEGLLNVIIFLFNNCYVDVLAYDEVNMTPLHYVVKYGQVDTLKYLISKLTQQDNINFVDIIGRTPLHLSIYNNDIQVCNTIIDILLSSGANMYLKTLHNETILSLACEFGKIEVVKHLIENHNYDINFDCKNKTPLEYAIEYSNYDIAKYLITKTDIKREISNKIATAALFGVVKRNDITNLKFLIEDLHIDYKLKNYNNKTILYVASKKGYFDIVKYLYSLDTE